MSVRICVTAGSARSVWLCVSFEPRFPWFRLLDVMKPHLVLDASLGATRCLLDAPLDARLHDLHALHAQWTPDTRTRNRTRPVLSPSSAISDLHGGGHTLSATIIRVNLTRLRWRKTAAARLRSTLTDLLGRREGRKRERIRQYASPLAVA